MEAPHWSGTSCNLVWRLRTCEPAALDEMKGCSVLGVIDGYCAIYQIVLWIPATASFLMVYLRQGFDQCRRMFYVKGWFAVFVLGRFYQTT